MKNPIYISFVYYISAISEQLGWNLYVILSTLLPLSLQ